MRLTLLIAKQITGRFKRMARRMQYFNGQLAKLENFMVFGQVYGEVCFSIRTKHNWSTGSFCKLKVSAHEVGMKMSFENIFNSGRALFCQLLIFFNVAQGIYNSSLTFAFYVI